LDKAIPGVEVTAPTKLRLDDLKIGAKALIVGVKSPDSADLEPQSATKVLLKRLKDLGFSPGEELTLLGRAPDWGGQGALRVLVGQTHLAMRSFEARHVVVEVLT
jgi:Fe2+ transport system protein FeoA